MTLKIIVSIGFLFFTTFVFGQVSNSDTLFSKKKITKSCQRPIENKDIELCHIKTDTLTYDLLKSCHELTSGNKKQIINSFLIRYCLPDGNTMVEVQILNNQLSDLAINGIINSGTKKILLEEIIGKEESEYIVLGHRWFFFK